MQSSPPLPDNENHENQTPKQCSEPSKSNNAEHQSPAVAQPPHATRLSAPYPLTHATILRHVRCHCDQPARCIRVSKYGPTQGQLFWSCALPLSHASRCTFFLWDNLPEAKRLLFRRQERRRRRRRWCW
jgi:hypothetical protein